MQSRTLWLAAALLTAAPAVIAQAPPAVPVAPAPSYTLRYKFTPGQTLAYKLTMDASGTITGGPGGQSIPLQQHMTMTFHQTVSDVRATDGVATVVTKFDTMDATLNGQPLTNINAQTGPLKDGITATISPTGKTLSVKANGADAANPPMGMDFSKLGTFQGTAQLPDAAVSIGDNWKGTMDLTSALGSQMSGVQAALSSTLNGVNTTDGKTIAGIGQTTTATINSPGGDAAPMKSEGSMTGTGTLKFDMDGGSVISQVNAAKLDMTLTPKAAAGAAPSGPLHLNFQINSDLERTDAAAAPAAPAPTTP